MSHDRQEIGWWVRSANEELYGPMSRNTIWNYVKDGVLTPDTLVRHSLGVEYAPLAEQPGLQGGIEFGAHGGHDRLAEAWPKKTAERLALAEGSFRCLRHNRAATQVCMCCLGAYCEKCRVNRGRLFHFCRKCHAGLYNARGVAFVVDSVLLRVLLVALAAGVGSVLGKAGPAVVLPVVLLPFLLFIFRDAMFGGAGPGKRMMAVRVVRCEDPRESVSYGQGFMRAIPNFIPLLNLVDLSVPYRDPLWRRLGDRWARTRVLYSEAKLGKLRDKASRTMQEKAGEFLPVEAPPLQEQLARLE